MLEIREGDAVTIKQIENAIINRAWEEGWVTPAAAPPRDRPLRRRGRLRPGRAWPPRSSCGAPATRSRCSSATRRSAASCASECRTSRSRSTSSSGASSSSTPRASSCAAASTSAADVAAEELREGYDAVVLATGSRVPRDLPVPGRELDGVHFAMDYLYQRNRWVARELGPEPTVAGSGRPRSEISARGKDVVVIGGGDTGADCVGNALREGARSIVQLELLSEPPAHRPDDRTPWPRVAAEVPPQLRDGGGPRARRRRAGLLGRDDRASATTAPAPWRRCTIAQAEPSRRSRAVPGTERELPAQLVLLAMGFLHPEQGLLDAARRRARPRAGTSRPSAPTRPRSTASSPPATRAAASR